MVIGLLVSDRSHRQRDSAHVGNSSPVTFRIVVEAPPARFLVGADRGAGLAGAPWSLGAGIQINELRELFVACRTVPWQTKV
jgi:hypothetical protein